MVRMRRKGNPYSLLVRMYISAATEENSMEVQKIPELPHDPSIPLLGIPPKETKSVSQNDLCTTPVAAIFTTVKISTQPK